MRTVPGLRLSAVSCVVLLGCGEPVGPGEDGITVRGRVVDELLNPQTNVGVLIQGHPVQTTDSEGKFTVSGVRVPYDISTALTVERGAVTYVGLTSDDPLIVVPANQYSNRNRATTSGYVTGGPGVPSPEHRTSVWSESPQTSMAASVNDSWYYYLTPEWGGPRTTAGTLHALYWQFDPTSGLPVTYVGYAAAPGFELKADTSLLGPDLLLAPVAETGSIVGSVLVPSGFRLSTKTLGIGFGAPVFPGVGWEIATQSGAAETFSYPTPAIPGATFAVSARAEVGGAWVTAVRTGLGATSTGVMVSLPTPPELISPAPGAIGLQTFRWTEMSDAVYLFSLRYTGGQIFIPAPPNYYVLTTATSVTIPDLTSLGIWPIQGTSYVWQVFAWSPFDRIDDVAAETWFAPQGDSQSATSATRGLTVR